MSSIKRIVTVEHECGVTEGVIELTEEAQKRLTIRGQIPPVNIEDLADKASDLKRMVANLQAELAEVREMLKHVSEFRFEGPGGAIIVWDDYDRWNVMGRDSRHTYCQSLSLSKCIAEAKRLAGLE